MRFATLAVAAVALAACGTPMIQPTTDPTTISRALDNLTGPAQCGHQRAARAGLLVQQLDALAGGDGEALFVTADALAAVQRLARQPRARLAAGTAQLTLLALTLPYLERLDPRLAAADSPTAAWFAALTRAGELGFRFELIAAGMQATPCPAGEG